LRKIIKYIHENSCSDSRVVPYGRTDGQIYMTKNRFSHFCKRAQRIQEHYVTLGTASYLKVWGCDIQIRENFAVSSLHTVLVS